MITDIVRSAARPVHRDPALDAVRRPPRRQHLAGPDADTVVSLLALCGIRDGSVVLDLTPNAAMVHPAAAAAGQRGVVLVAAPAALTALTAGPAPAGPPLRAGSVSHAFADLPGGRLLLALRPLLRPAARVAVTAVDEASLRTATAVAAYDIVHFEQGAAGLVVAALRARPLS